MRALPDTTIHLGDRGDLRDPSLPRRLGITTVVDLALEEAPPVLDRERVLFRIPLTDGGGNDPQTLLLAIATVENLLRYNTPSLVVCSAGLSRTPAIVAAALSGLSGESLQSSLALICASGPADVSPALWASIQRALTLPGRASICLPPRG